MVWQTPRAAAGDGQEAGGPRALGKDVWKEMEPGVPVPTPGRLFQRWDLLEHEWRQIVPANSAASG